MKKFMDGLWQGLAFIVVIIIVFGVAGWLIYTGRKPTDVFKKAYGEIINPVRDTDVSRAAAIRNAIDAVWRDS